MSMTRQVLSSKFVPEIGLVPDSLALSADHQDLLKDAEEELSERAKQSEDGCWGLFPGLPGADDLPASRKFSLAKPVLQNYMNGKQNYFSWLRYSHGRAIGEPNYHLDANGGIGLADVTSNSQLLPRYEIWRLLANFSETTERRLAYLNVDPRTLQLENRQGRISLAEGEEIDEWEEQQVVVPPREGSRYWVASLCVSRVLHAGIETPAGHFLGSWSIEMQDPTVYRGAA